MKNFYTLVGLLLVGILKLSSCNADDDTEWLNTDRWMLLILNVSDVPVLSNLTIDDVEKYNIERCAKNGPDAYNIMKQSEEQLDNCTATVILENVEIAQSNPARYRGKAGNTLGLTCGNLTAIKDCWKQYVVSLSACDTPEEIKSDNVTEKVTNAMLDYVCENGGDRITNAILEGSAHCLSSNTEAILNCAGQSLVNYFNAAKRNGTVFTDLQSLYSINLGLTECTYMEEFHQCTVNLLKQCPSAATKDFLDGIFDVIKKATICNDLLKSSGSSDTNLNVAETSDAEGKV